MQATAPKHLKKRWETALLLPLMFATALAIRAVIVVPTLAPKTTGRAFSIVIRSCCARMARMLMGMTEACTIPAKIIPIPRPKSGLFVS